MWNFTSWSQWVVSVTGQYTLLSIFNRNLIFLAIFFVVTTFLVLISEFKYIYTSLLHLIVNLWNFTFSHLGHNGWFRWLVSIRCFLFFNRNLIFQTIFFVVTTFLALISEFKCISASFFAFNSQSVKCHILVTMGGIGDWSVYVAFYF